MSGRHRLHGRHRPRRGPLRSLLFAGLVLAAAARLLADACPGGER